MSPNNYTVCKKCLAFSERTKHITCKKTKICYHALINEHLDCFKFSIEHNRVYLSDDMITEIIREGLIDFIQYLWDKKILTIDSESARCFARDAAFSNQLDCVKFAHEKGFNLDVDYRFIAQDDPDKNLECAKYLYEHRSVESNRMFGNLCSLMAGWSFSFMKYFHEQGEPFDENTCKNAASFSNIESLKYAYEHGAPFTTDILLHAMSHELDCLKFAIKVLTRTTGKPIESLWPKKLNADNIRVLKKGYVFKCYKYAFLLGAPWYDQVPVVLQVWVHSMKKSADIIIRRLKMERELRINAAIIIQRAIMPIIYRPGGRLMENHSRHFESLCG
jgi:hypothetical protein